MATKKTRFSTNRDRAVEDRARIDAVLDMLLTRIAEDLTAADYEGLSDLSRPAAERLAERWMELPHPLRLALTREMVSSVETDIEHHYDRALTVALLDEQDDVKLTAFEGLTDTTDPRLLDYLLTRLPGEENPAVRAAGAEALGQFVLHAEMHALEAPTADRLRDVLFTLLENDDVEAVRLRALESAGYLANDAEVADAIQDAWDSGRHDAQVSALRAMGRQCNPRWLDQVLAQFRSDEPELRFEAARAVGTLDGQRTVPRIIDLTDDDDVEVQMAAIASLGAIGGDAAIGALRALERSDSVAIADAAGAALLLDNAARPPNSLWQA